MIKISHDNWTEDSFPSILALDFDFKVCKDWRKADDTAVFCETYTEACEVASRFAKEMEKEVK